MCMRSIGKCGGPLPGPAKDGRPPVRSAQRSLHSNTIKNLAEGKKTHISNEE
jgi:hypothetical protein